MTEIVHASLAVRFSSRRGRRLRRPITGKSTLAYSLADGATFNMRTTSCPGRRKGRNARNRAALRRPPAIQGIVVLGDLDPGGDDNEGSVASDRPPGAASDRPSRLAALFVLRRMDHGDQSLSRASGCDGVDSAAGKWLLVRSDQRSRRGRLVRHYLDIAALVPVYELRLPGLDSLDSVLDCIEATAANSPPAAVCTI